MRYCTAEKITFTRSRPGNKNDGAHVEQKNWSVVRHAVGYGRYDTPAELAALNEWTHSNGMSPPKFYETRDILRMLSEEGGRYRCPIAKYTSLLKAVIALFFSSAYE